MLTGVIEHGTQLMREHLTVEVEGAEAMAVHLVAAVAAWRLTRRNALNEAAKVIKVDARAQIGHYQPEVGEYPAWAPLTDWTEEKKALVGAPPDAPLYRFGDLQNSFRSTLVGSDEVIVGSTDPVMEYHEFGTVAMPARPVLGPALVKNEKKIQALLAGAIVDAVLVGQRLGYRFLPAGEDNAESGDE